MKWNHLPLLKLLIYVDKKKGVNTPRDLEAIKSATTLKDKLFFFLDLNLEVRIRAPCLLDVARAFIQLRLFCLKVTGIARHTIPLYKVTTLQTTFDQWCKEQ